MYFSLKKEDEPKETTEEMYNLAEKLFKDCCKTYDWGNKQPKYKDVICCYPGIVENGYMRDYQFKEAVCNLTGELPEKMVTW